MDTKLRPYPEYKDSALPWLGEVPAHWRMVRMKHLFRERNVRGHPDEPLLAATQTKGVVRKEDYENRTVLAMKDLHTLKLVCLGDFVISLRSFQGGIEYARCRGIISPAYTILYPVDDTSHGYFAAFFKSRTFIDALRLYVTGIRQGQNIDYVKLSRSPLPVPPPDEQRVISAFVGKLSQRINRFIRNRQSLIDVLKEQKQAIINRAVTRGLDTNVRLKPSGIDWLGEIPKHWELVPLYAISHPKTVINCQDRELLSVYLNLGVIRFSEVPEKRTNPTSNDLSKYQAVDPGDFVLNNQQAWRGSVGVSPYSGIVSPAYLVLSLDSNLHPLFANYLLRSTAMVNQYLVCSKGVGSIQRNLYWPHLKRMAVPIPPLDEQEKIVRHIDRKTIVQNSLIDQAQREIDLIREYRTRLIVDVVTGKVDVRNMKANVSGKTSLVTDSKQVKPRRTANVHFKRSVFAAEIVHRLHQEPTFGHVKFEKLIFLCEKQCGVDLGSTYYRQAAGPYDNTALRSIDSQMEKQRWYVARKAKKRYQYVPLAKAGGHKTYFDRHFAGVEAEFSNVVETFRKLNTERCEIVATLYSAWEDLLANDEEATDDRIVEQVLYHWHQSKQKIDESRWRSAIGWMKEKDFVPR